MSHNDNDISKIEELDRLRSAPNLSEKQYKLLLTQLKNMINKADWLTIGVMSPTLDKGLNAIRKIEEKFKYNKMKCMTLPSSKGPIFLKGNQKTGEIHARLEYGLGEGILITMHNDDNSLLSKTIGPFPLDFFN